MPPLKTKNYRLQTVPRPIILKFGGTSLGSAERIATAAKIVRKSRGAVVVTSAMSQVTNLLIATAQAALKKDEKIISKNLATLREKHFAACPPGRIAQTKPIRREIETLLDELAQLMEGIKMLQELTPRSLDFVCSFGERMSSWLMVEALERLGKKAQRFDSRELVRTDNQFGAAEVEWKTTQSQISKAIPPALKKGIIPVVTGYIGSTKDDETTTLGRGGSDYSAAILGVCLDASEIQIWTDVDGMMTCDPRLIPHAKILPQISFQEAAELAYFGAKVLHPKTIQPAVEKNIPVKILNTMNPGALGTTILGTFAKSARTIKAISLKKNISVINICSSRMFGPYGFLAQIFAVFAKHKVPVDVVATTEVSVSITVEDGSFAPELIKDLEAFATVKVVPNQTIISVVGEGLKNDYTVEQRLFDALAKAKIPTELISKGASQINLTFIVSAADAEHCARELHKTFFEG